MMTRDQVQVGRGFTIVEMLVVVGTIALLLALLLPAVSGAVATGRKTTELNNLRQVHTAWQLYATQNDEQILPGYLDVEVQDAWDVEYKYPNGDVVSAAQAASYPWRLSSFLDHSYEMFLGYRQDPEPDLGLYPEVTAEQPQFGYNALHLGGWWTMQAGAPQHHYVDATSPTGPVNVVTRTISGVRRSDELVVFCSSVRVESAGTLRDYSNQSPGYHYVEPSMGPNGVRRWAQSPTDPFAPEATGSAVAAPRTRFVRTVSLICVDGHTEALSMYDLMSSRRFIDSAESETLDFTSSDSAPTPASIVPIPAD